MRGNRHGRYFMWLQSHARHAKSGHCEHAKARGARTH